MDFDEVLAELDFVVTQGVSVLARTGTFTGRETAAILLDWHAKRGSATGVEQLKRTITLTFGDPRLWILEAGCLLTLSQRACFRCGAVNEKHLERCKQCDAELGIRCRRCNTKLVVSENCGGCSTLTFGGALQGIPKRPAQALQRAFDSMGWNDYGNARNSLPLAAREAIVQVGVELSELEPWIYCIGTSWDGVMMPRAMFLDGRRLDAGRATSWFWATRSRLGVVAGRGQDYAARAWLYSEIGRYEFNVQQNALLLEAVDGCRVRIEMREIKGPPRGWLFVHMLGAAFAEQPVDRLTSYLMLDDEASRYERRVDDLVGAVERRVDLLGAFFDLVRRVA